MRRVAAALGAAFFVLAARAPAHETPTLHLFFTLDTPDLARVIREARKAAGADRFRPVFLLDQWPREPFEPSPEFLEAVAELGQDVPVIDVEGLELARRFGVRSTPCVVRTGRRVHRAAGARVDWKELIACD
jgi:hypothetical protein